jgi:hypothetical protein
MQIGNEDQINNQEDDEFIDNPTGYLEIDLGLRRLFVDKAKEDLGEDKWAKLWKSDLKGAYFQAAKEIKDFLAKAQKNPFNLPQSFEILKNGIVESLDDYKKKLSFSPDEIKRSLETIIVYGLEYYFQNDEKWAREGDRMLSNYRQKSIVDNPKYTAEQKSRILVAFDEYIKEKISNPFDLMYVSTGNIVWTERLNKAIRGPTPTPTPKPIPSPSQTRIPTTKRKNMKNQ